MQVNIEELSKRLESSDNIANSVSRIKRGEVKVISDFTNRPGKKNLDEDTKEFIGTLAHFESQDSIASVFKVSQARVSQIKNGLNSSSKVGSFDVDLKGRIDKNVKDVRKQVSELALGKLSCILEGITKDKIDRASLSEITTAASNLGKLSHVEEEREVNNNNFVFFTPRTKQEDDYEVVEVVA